MSAIDAYRRDRETGASGLTVAGLLLVGRAEAIREWRTRHMVDYRLVDAEDDADTRWQDRLTWEGNLFDAYDAIYPRLVAGLPVPFRLQGGTRIDESQVHVVLREALVNLLVHTDYAETQPSLIRRSANGYLFRNAGSSRVLESDLLSGNRSDPRNPTLVRMFRIVGLAEEAGTGIPKIIQAWRDLGFQLPSIDVGTERYEFTLELLPSHLISDTDRAWLYSLGGSWTEAEQLALVSARHTGFVDNLMLRTLTGRHPSDATRVLGSLRDRGFLQMRGGGRATRYELRPYLGLNTVAPHPTTPVQLALSSEGMTASSEGITANSEGMTASSEGITANSEGMTADHTVSWMQLEAIAAPARQTRRLLPTERDRIILGLCALVPLSLADLAQLMNRNEAYLREAVRVLIASGSLAFQYPNQPNHPQQKYVSLPLERVGFNIM